VVLERPPARIAVPAAGKLHAAGLRRRGGTSRRSIPVCFFRWYRSSSSIWCSRGCSSARRWPAR
jgi:hypothetical protein